MSATESATESETAVRGDGSNDATGNVTSDTGSSAGVGKVDVKDAPGSVTTAVTSFASAADLASALRRASTAHGAHERRIGHADPNWPDWYAAYMVAERSGGELPT
jgi:hypothetical protein